MDSIIRVSQRQTAWEWPLVGSRPADRGIATPGAFKRRKSGEDYVIVDGYNVIFAWDTLRNCRSTT